MFRRITHLFAATAAAILLATATATPSGAADLAAPPLDVDTAITNIAGDRYAAALVQWDPITLPVFVGMQEQETYEWQIRLVEEEKELYKIVNVRYEGCLASDIDPTGSAVNQPVVVERCADAEDQIWQIPTNTIDGTTTIRNLASGLCVSQQGISPINDRRLREQVCDGLAPQRFRFIPRER